MSDGKSSRKRKGVTLSHKKDYAAKTKKRKAEKPQDDFNEVKFKFLIRDPQTALTGFQKFLEYFTTDSEEENTKSLNARGLFLLESYLRSSPQCTEVLNVLERPSKSSQEVHAVFRWLRIALKECKEVVASFSEVRQHIVNTLLTKHMSTIINSLRQGNKPVHAKATLLLLADIIDLGYKYARVVLIQFDFNHRNLPHLLSQRDRKDPCDVRSSMVMLLMRLLLIEDPEITKTLVEQKVLLQEVLKGLAHDRSEFVTFVLLTIHDTVVTNEPIGKTAKVHLFSTPVLKELLSLYQWPGPKFWKSQPSELEKRKYTSEQREVAEVLHAMLLDLCATHKPGLCFYDKSFGLSSKNKNPAMTKLLEALLMSYSAPLSYKLALAVLKTCPDQVSGFLKHLHSHLVPRAVDTWITCVKFFEQIIQNHEWPPNLKDPGEGVDKISQLVHFLFPPENIISALKDGYNHLCPTVRHKCLQALLVVIRKGQHFRDISSHKFGDKAPLTQAIHGFILKAIPSPLAFVHVLNQITLTDKFSVSITRELYKDTDFPLPQVTRFELFVTILKTFCVAPHLLNSGPEELAPLILSLLTEVTSSGLEIDRPPSEMPSTLPALSLLQAFSACDVRKLPLFGEAGNKGDKKVGLLQQLIGLTQREDGMYRDAAQRMVVKILMSTGLFEGHQGELHIWLRHLECSGEVSSEVVTFLVNILRQYIVNPYPANDHLLEMVDDESHLLMDKTAVSQSFSALTMLALKSNFNSSQNVHQYICCVLVDILHSLHNSRAFTKVVHALSQHLNPHIVVYITLHSSEEAFSCSNVEQRLGRKQRLSHLKQRGGVHPGLLMIRTLMKENEEHVPEKAAEALAGVSPNYYVPLLQQSLCYLHELVHFSSKRVGVSKNKKLAQVCMETMKGVLRHMTTSKKITEKTNASTSNADVSDEKKDVSVGNGENGDPEAPPENEIVNSSGERDLSSLTNNKYCVILQDDVETSIDSWSHVPGEVMESLPEGLRHLLQHPLSQWVFSQGFKKCDAEFEWLVTQYCGVLQSTLAVRSSGLPDYLTAIVDRYRCQMWSALQDFGDVPDNILPLLGKCVEVLFSASGHAHTLSAAFMLLRLPQKCFVVPAAAGSQVTSLSKILVQLAKNVNVDPEVLSDVVDAKDFSNKAVRQLFDLVSCLKEPALEAFALNCMRALPSLAVACENQTCLRMLNNFVEMSAMQRELFERFLTFSPTCRVVCSKWVQQNRALLTDKKDALSPLMLLYVQVASRLGDDVANDPAVQVIADIFGANLNGEIPSVAEGPLRVISSLIDSGVFSLQAMCQASGSVLRLALKGKRLLEGHFSILAASLREGPLKMERQKDPEIEHRRMPAADSWGGALVACLQYLTTEPMTSKRDWEGCEDSLRRLVELLNSLLSRPITSADRDTIMEFWPSLIKSCLKYHYKNTQVLALVRKLVARLFAKGEDVEHVEKQLSPSDVTAKMDDTCLASVEPEEKTSETVPLLGDSRSEPADGVRKHCVDLELSSREYSPLILELFNMCVGHSEFLVVMKGGELQGIKDELVWLLVTLQQLEKKCCMVLSYNLIMASYGASLSQTDQRILFLLAACEKYGGSERKLRPMLWGEAAVSYLEVQQHIGPSLIGTLQLKQVVEHIDPAVMETSILHFPLLRSADPQQTVNAEDLMSRASCYDPCFFLPLFCHFLGPEHIVEVRPFIHNNCLGFVLAALSSHNPEMRKLAYLALANLYAHIEGAQRLPEKNLLLAFFDVLRNSLTKENQKLCCIITLFLTRAVKIICDPGHNMYCAVQSYLLLKAALDVNSIPEFYKFFNSAFPVERGWLLQLLQDGLRETSDHRVFERNYFFKLVTSHISSSLGDVKTMRGALRVLVKGCSIATVAKDWVMEHGLLAWLTSFIKDSLQDTVEDCQLISQVLYKLWFTRGYKSTKMWWLSLPRLARDLLRSSVLACIQLLLSKFSAVNKQTLESLLKILYNPEERNLSAVTNQPSPSLVAITLWHLGHLSRSKVAELTLDLARELSSSFGFLLPSLTHATDVGQAADKNAKGTSHLLEKDGLASVRYLTLCLLQECDVTQFHHLEELKRALTKVVHSRCNS